VGAVAGVGFGGKVGIAKLSGDILPSSGDVGSALYYGAVMEITTFPMLDLELHVNYLQQDFDYTFDIGGVPIQESFTFRDLSGLAMLKKNLIAVPMSPVKLYIGGGMGVHLLNTEVAAVAIANPALADDPLTLGKNSLKYSGHALLGMTVGPPMAPIALYGEARYGRIFATERINTSEIEGGLLIRF